MSMDVFNQTTHYSPETENNDIALAQITVFDGTAKPVKFDLTGFGKSVVTFGREEDNDIQIRSLYVSRHHGHFRLMGDKWVIEDLHSKNGLNFSGISISGRILGDGNAIRIDDGVETTIGGVLLVFSCNSNETEWETITFTGDRNMTIGRDSACDIVLNHVSISKIHARLIIKDGQYYIIDNGSTNGIFVNGRKVEGRVQLHEKDVILITNSKLIFGSGKISFCCFKKGISVDAFGIVKKVDKNRKIICNDVSLNIKPCELVAIIGGSGAGKSTIMNCISGYSIPTSGSVAVNGMDLYSNFNALKHIIGYVPQSDIVFDNLTVFDMLSYAAKLRLPKDISATERRNVINHVIDMVELTIRKDTLIKKLSGGQKKRASIAVELLSDPNLFFLDEPASGLDPGTERNLMKTLRNMTANGKTVIFVTHSTLNLHLCDKIVFMGAGGNLCFCGTYEEALRFFEVKDVVDVYNLITENSQKYREQYLQTQKTSIVGDRPSSMPKKTKRHGGFRQVTILCQRHLHMLFNDHIRLLMLMLQAPLLATLIALVANGEQFNQYEMTKSLLFALSCSAFWIGILNSIQEICKERNILKREYMTGLRLGSYIFSKVLIMGIICTIQSVLLVSVFILMVGQPGRGVVLENQPYLEIFATTFLTALAASAMGIFVSSLFKNADRAMTVAPLLLMPQLLFSGLIFTLEGASKIISWIAVCRFSMEAYGTTANLNSLEMRLQQQGFQIEHLAEEYFTFSRRHFAFALVVLCIFTFVFSVVAGIVLQNIKKEKN